MHRPHVASYLALAAVLTTCASCGGGSASGGSAPAVLFTLSLQKAGGGGGSVDGSGVECGATCTATASEGSTVQLTATPDAGSVLSTWSGCDSASGATCTVSMTAARTVAAIFDPDPSIRHDLLAQKAGTGMGTVVGAGIFCGASCTSSLLHGATVRLVASPAAGSALAGWTGCDSVVQDTCQVKMAQARTVSATFNLAFGVQRVLTMTRAGTGSGTVLGGGTYCTSSCTATFADATQVILEAVPGVTSTFGGWSGCDSVSGARCTVSMGSARTATASFNRIVGFWHRLDVWTNGQGSGTVKGGDVDCGATCGGRPLDGSTVTLTATPSAWSRFTGWSGCDSASGSTCTLRVTEDRMVVAKFDPVMVSDPTWRVARAGTTNSAAIRADGTLWMWGGNRSGQLGDGTRLNRETPVLVGTGFVDVSLGDYHTLAIKSDGTLWGWGSNQSAQLGDGTVEDRLTPTLVGAGFVAASAPHGRSVALKGDGSLWGWGAFGSSRLHPPYYQQPTLVGPNFQAVSDDGFDCALLVGPMGTLWRWHGSEDAPVSFLSAGGGFVTYELGLGLKADGTLWGIPDTGDPTSLSSGVAQASSGKAGDFTFFRWHAMVKSDGTLWSWGSNGGGQLGLGGTSDQATPALVGSGYRSVSAGVLHTLAIKADGTLWAWGENSSGQLGEKANTSVPTAIGAGFTSLAAGSSFSLAVKPQGEIWGNSVPDVLYAWGDNRGRQVSSDANPEDETAPGMSGRVRGISRAAGGEMHTIALKTDGTVWAWGDNAFGQIGNGTTSDPDGEVQVGTGFKAIAAGKWHSAGIKTDGSLWTWGAGESGQLGNGTGTSRSAPGLVGTGFATVACGSNHTLAIKTDGTLWAWGSNLKGQLGDGTTTSRQSPVFVGSGFQSVAAGFAHTVALKTDGTVWTWGDNTYGQIGDGSATPRSTPVLVTSGGRSIASGHHHVLAVKTNGSLVAWGLNASSQLGDGTTTDRAAPVTVGWGFTAMAAGRDHSLGLKADTTLWAWGDNKRAQLSFVRVRVRPGKVQ